MIEGRCVVLASASPRRRELLAAILDDFTADPAGVPETVSGDPDADARRLAAAKALAVAGRYPACVVLGADTIVHDGARAYGKPSSVEDAETMLRVLSGRDHRVYSGIAVVRDGIAVAETSVSTVWMRRLTVDEIRAYAATERHLDKAGAYAIQDDHMPVVERFDGCYCSIMGLPLWRTWRLLGNAGVACRPPTAEYDRCTECPERGER